MFEGADLTGKPPQFLSRTSLEIGHVEPELKGLDSNVERGPSFVQIDAVMVLWAQR